jgi:hypothetical protein
MLIVESYAIAVIMCIVTMMCWGSWANTQKLATREMADRRKTQTAIFERAGHAQFFL